MSFCKPKAHSPGIHVATASLVTSFTASPSPLTRELTVTPGVSVTFTTAAVTTPAT